MNNGKTLTRIIGHGNFPRLLREYNTFLQMHGKNAIAENTFYARFNRSDLETVRFVQTFAATIRQERQEAERMRNEMLQQAQV
jgi:hypothetical protein